MEIQIKNLQKKVRFRAGQVLKAARAVISAQGLDKAPGVLNFCFVDDRTIRRLNSKYHFSRWATDVLAFDMRSAPSDAFLADIIISADTARSNAREFGTSVEYELCLYVVHGVLHLSGYDDRNEVLRRKMQKRSEVILCRLFKRLKR